MENRAFEILKESKIVAIARGASPEQCRNVAKALRDGGIKMIEVTFDQNSTDHFAATTTAIRCIAEEFGDMCVGAGTVMTTEQVVLAFNAGAKYIISPDTNPEVIRLTKSLGMVSMPGALSPTEIAEAYKYGADAVKVFPAGNMGSSYVKALRAPLKHIPMVVVGGINEENIGEFLKVGAIGAGVGGNLVNTKLIEAGKFEEITELAKKFVAACK